jgi:hypothetical protein
VLTIMISNVGFGCKICLGSAALRRPVCVDA